MTFQTVILSHSELRSLVTKAARGGGLEWGLAEEAGWAAEWLARHSLPAADWATLWLAAATQGGADPVSFGVALVDQMAVHQMTTGASPDWPKALPQDLPAPGFVLPFLHRLAAFHGPMEVISPGGRVAMVGQDGLPSFGPAWGGRCLDWAVQPAAAAQLTRPEVSASVIECLEGLALRTTVPPSDTSRQDAGSATSDND